MRTRTTIKTINLIICAVIIAIILQFACTSVLTQANSAANALELTDSVYLGGTPIGVVMDSSALTVIEKRSVITKEGAKIPLGLEKLEIGDWITAVNGVAVKSPSDISSAVAAADNDSLTLTAVRNGESMQIDVYPLWDIVENARKIGLIVKNEIAGVGTLTFIRADNKRFGGLGHKIFDEFSRDTDFYTSGRLYSGKIIGVVKGEKGKAGELRGSFDRSSQPIGTINANNLVGIYGTAEAKMYDNRPMVSIKPRGEIKQGKAYIYTTIDGESPSKYEIEIVKAAYQSGIEDKSMVIHVTDEALLRKTGGIVQGMSGSPIIQNGYLIGAVTHVFINDPTRGYGVYLDWMLNN